MLQHFSPKADPGRVAFSTHARRSLKKGYGTTRVKAGYALYLVALFSAVWFLTEEAPDFRNYVPRGPGIPFICVFHDSSEGRVVNRKPKIVVFGSIAF